MAHGRKRGVRTYFGVLAAWRTTGPAGPSAERSAQSALSASASRKPAFPYRFLVQFVVRVLSQNAAQAAEARQPVHNRCITGAF